jgi:hypothetical protein
VGIPAREISGERRPQAETNNNSRNIFIFEKRMGLILQQTDWSANLIKLPIGNALIAKPYMSSFCK